MLILDWHTEYVLAWGRLGRLPQIIKSSRIDCSLTERKQEHYNTMACDKYYSHLDGTWYYEPESIWGGGRNSGVNDYYAELYVGRIAAYNASMVSNASPKNHLV